MAYDDLVPGTGKMVVQLDDDMESTNGMPRVRLIGEDQTLLAAESVSPPVTNFSTAKWMKSGSGRIALDLAQILTNRFNVTPELPDNLMVWFDCNEGQGPVLNNFAGDKKGTLYGDTTWTKARWCRKRTGTVTRATSTSPKAPATMWTITTTRPN